MTRNQWFPAEFPGTFLLVFFGCGSVTVAVLFEAHAGLFQVAIVWGPGLALAIYLTGAASGAHLNPAISLAFVVWRDFPVRRFFGYVAAQFGGAIVAAIVLLASTLTQFAAFHPCA